MTETNFAIPPGDVLAEWLDENDMTQTELAARLGRSVKHVNQVVNGVASLTSGVARELDTVTTIPAKFWLRMENTYRLDKARLEQEPISEDDAAWLALMPTADLRKRTRISATARDKSRLLQELLSFFGVASVPAWREVYGRPVAQFRQSTATTARPEAIATWLRLGQIEASKVDAAHFDRDALRAALTSIKALTREPNGAKLFAELVETLRGVGVILLVIADVRGTRLHGATWWKGGTPVVQLTARHRTDDLFWFTLLHELAHVLLHRRGATFLDGQDSGIDPAAETAADTFAGDFLIPPDQASALATIVSLGDVQRLARTWGVSPGVVVGRLHHDRLRDYSWGAKLKRKITLSS